VPEFENPSEASSGPRAEGDREALTRGTPTRMLGARAEVRAAGALRDLTALVAPPHATGRSHDAVERTATPVAEIGPTITATLKDGPLEGSRIEAEVIEGRPPKTIDVPADGGSTCRYCLEGWVQSGRSAIYTFLYRV
jgi:hypothetical protein